MKRWNVITLDEAKKNVAGIQVYISDVLCEPAVALRLIRRIYKAIASLREMPERYPVYDAALGLRRMNVGNYAVFYRVMPQKNLVAVHAVLYGARDIDRALSERLED